MSVWSASIGVKMRHMPEALRKRGRPEKTASPVLAMAQEERTEKLHVVEIYNARLTQRERRRDFLRDRGLLNLRRMQVRGSVMLLIPVLPLVAYGVHGQMSPVPGCPLVKIQASHYLRTVGKGCLISWRLSKEVSYYTSFRAVQARCVV